MTTQPPDVRTLEAELIAAAIAWHDSLSHRCAFALHDAAKAYKAARLAAPAQEQGKAEVERPEGARYGAKWEPLVQWGDDEYFTVRDGKPVYRDPRSGLFRPVSFYDTTKQMEADIQA